MNQESKNFLFNLLKTPSPTGFEQPVQRVVRSRMEKYADEIRSDLHGNLFVGINTKAKKRVMLAGHCDQIGFIVRNIDDKGMVILERLGGIDPKVVPGSVVVVYNKRNKVTGVIGKKAIHLEDANERTQMKVDGSKYYLDIGAKNKKEAEKLVTIGNPATFELRVHELGADLISGPGLDDKVGLFIAMEALRLCARSKLDVALYAVSTVQEEVGLRGATTAAYEISPEVGIAIDVTHANDDPYSSEKTSAPCKLGEGPGIYVGPNVNPIVFDRLVSTAKKKKIAHQVLPAGGLLGNDANAIQVARAGAAAGSIGVPNRYMHTQVEVCSMKDLERSASLLAEFIKGITERTDFRPR